MNSGVAGMPAFFVVPLCSEPVANLGWRFRSNWFAFGPPTAGAVARQFEVLVSNGPAVRFIGRTNRTPRTHVLASPLAALSLGYVSVVVTNSVGGAEALGSTCPSSAAVGKSASQSDGYTAAECRRGTWEQTLTNKCAIRKA
jgi:hypothetical protein